MNPNLKNAIISTLAMIAGMLLYDVIAALFSG